MATQRFVERPPEYEAVQYIVVRGKPKNLEEILEFLGPEWQVERVNGGGTADFRRYRNGKPVDKFKYEWASLRLWNKCWVVRPQGANRHRICMKDDKSMHEVYMPVAYVHRHEWGTP